MTERRWPALLSREQAAEYLGLSVSTFSREKAAGRIKSKVIRGKYLYWREDLDRFIDDLPYGFGEFKGNKGGDDGDDSEVGERSSEKTSVDRSGKQRVRRTAARAG